MQNLIDKQVSKRMREERQQEEERKLRKQQLRNSPAKSNRFSLFKRQSPKK